MPARGLGKGLDALIPNSAGKDKSSNKTNENKEEKKEIIEKGSNEHIIKITKIEPNRKQPRKKFDEDALQELADSIKQFGLLQPILVQDRNTFYEIVAGERRWRAAKLAGLREVPVIIKKFSDQEIVEISLIENIQRENLNPIEEAQAYKRLLTEFNLKQDQVAERVSKSRTAVTNSMRLLKLCEDVQQMVIEDMISTGHARTLIGIENPKLQYEVAQKIFDEKMSVREAEKLVKNIGKEKKEKLEKSIDSGLQIIYHDLEEKMKDSLGTKVCILPKENGAGKIEIDFFSHDELDRIMEILMKMRNENR